MLVNFNAYDCNEHVKFVSYTGKYPCLCSGILTLEIDGETVKFGMDLDCEYGKFWYSGGCTNWHTGDVEHGDWKIDVQDIPEKYRKYANEIDIAFNENVERGCCGGCL